MHCTLSNPSTIAAQRGLAHDFGLQCRECALPPRLPLRSQTVVRSFLFQGLSTLGRPRWWDAYPYRTIQASRMKTVDRSSTWVYPKTHFRSVPKIDSSLLDQTGATFCNEINWPPSGFGSFLVLSVNSVHAHRFTVFHIAQAFSGRATE